MALYVALGSYVGDGVDNRAITGVGFQPKVVIVKSVGTAGTDVWRTDTMGGDLSKPGGEVALTANQIQSLDADGFTIGTHARVNTNTVTYHWIALGGDGVHTTSYTGNSTAARAITGAGFAPAVTIISGAGTEPQIFRTSGFVGDYGLPLESATSGNANRIQSLDADGFTLGSSAFVNGSGVTYHAISIQAQAGVFAVDKYTGTGVARNETGLGFDPDLVLVKRDFSSPAHWRHNAHAVSTDSVLQDGFVLGTTANGITGFVTDGFSLGTSSDVNNNGSTHYALAFAENAPAPVTTHQAAFDLVLGLDLDALPVPTRTPAFDLILGAGMDLDPDAIKQVAFDLILGLSLDAAPVSNIVRQAAFDLVLGMDLDALPVPTRRAAFDLLLGLGIEPEPEVVRQVAFDLILGLAIDAQPTLDVGIAFDLILGLSLDGAVQVTRTPAFDLFLTLSLDAAVQVTKRVAFDLWLGLDMAVQSTGPGTGVVVTHSGIEQKRQAVINALQAGDTIRVNIPRGAVSGLNGIGRPMSRTDADPDRDPAFTAQFIDDADPSHTASSAATGQTARYAGSETLTRMLERQQRKR